MKKKCTKCGEPKKYNEFNWKIKGVARRTQCAACDKVARRKNRKPEPTTKEKEAILQAEREKESKLFNPLITSKWV